MAKMEFVKDCWFVRWTCYTYVATILLQYEWGESLVCYWNQVKFMDQLGHCNIFSWWKKCYSRNRKCNSVHYSDYEPIFNDITALQATVFPVLDFYLIHWLVSPWTWAYWVCLGCLIFFHGLWDNISMALCKTALNTLELLQSSLCCWSNIHDSYGHETRSKDLIVQYIYFVQSSRQDKPTNS